MLNLAALREICAAATPGPWKTWGMSVRWDKGGDSDVNKSVLIATLHTENERGQLHTRDSTYIAALNPQVVMALLASLEKADALAGALGSHTHRDERLFLALEEYKRARGQEG